MIKNRNTTIARPLSSYSRKSNGDEREQNIDVMGLNGSYSLWEGEE